jgi:16S rRNA processing protein RimM
MRQLNHSAAQSPDQETGSPQSGGPVFLAVGRLHRPHGVRGEIELEIITDSPERLTPGKVLYVGEKHQRHRISMVRPKGQGLLVGFEDLTDRDQVALLRNLMLYVRADELPPLPPGEYYHYQLIGLRVVTETGEVLGRLTEIIETGANDVYVVTNTAGQEVLLPAIEAVILEISLECGEIRVRPQVWE